MTVGPPPNGEVLKTAHVTGLVFPGAKKEPRLGIYAVSSRSTPEREMCREEGHGRQDSEAELGNEAALVDIDRSPYGERSPVAEGLSRRS